MSERLARIVTLIEERLPPGNSRLRRPALKTPHPADHRSAVSSAAQRLVDQASHWTQRHRVSCTLVFDPVHRKRPPTGPHDIRIVISRHRGRNAADRTVLDIVRKSAEPGAICVYTSDKDLANALKPLGVTVRSAGSFRHELDDACNPFT